MEEWPSREANRSSASQQILLILCNPKVHDCIHKSQPPVTILSQIDPVHVPKTTSGRSILILSFHQRLGLSSRLLPSGFVIKTLYAAILAPYVLHDPPILVFLIRWPEECLVRSTEHKALCCVDFSTPLLPRSSKAQISSSAPYSGKPSACIPPSVWATKFLTHIKQHAKL